jgi:hypothetical protein
VLLELDLPDVPELRAAVTAFLERGRALQREALLEVRAAIMGQPGGIAERVRAAVYAQSLGLPLTARTLHLAAVALAGLPPVGDLLRELARATGADDAFGLVARSPAPTELERVVRLLATGPEARLAQGARGIVLEGRPPEGAANGPALKGAAPSGALKDPAPDGVPQGPETGPGRANRSASQQGQPMAPDGAAPMASLQSPSALAARQGQRMSPDGAAWMAAPERPSGGAAQQGAGTAPAGAPPMEALETPSAGMARPGQGMAADGVPEGVAQPRAGGVPDLRASPEATGGGGNGAGATVATDARTILARLAGLDEGIGAVPAALTAAGPVPEPVRALARLLHDRIELQQAINAARAAAPGRQGGESGGARGGAPDALHPAAGAERTAIAMGPAAEWPPGASLSANDSAAHAGGRIGMEGGPAPVTVSIPLAWGDRFVTVDLAVERDASRRHQAAAAGRGAVRARLAVRLGRIGEVAADLRLAGQALRCHLAAERATKDALAAAAQDLRARWEGIGLRVEALDCGLLERAGPPAAGALALPPRVELVA